MGCAAGVAWGSNFYPRPPRGGRLRIQRHSSSARSISIHALREEGDAGEVSSLCKRHDFYPRPPRGGRQAHTGQQHGQKQFLSTPSARRATKATRSQPQGITFLSTPSARRATPCSNFFTIAATYFYPRPPRGGRLISWLSLAAEQGFLSTPSARRATGAGLLLSTCKQLFLSTPSARRATG